MNETKRTKPLPLEEVRKRQLAKLWDELKKWKRRNPHIEIQLPKPVDENDDAEKP